MLDHDELEAMILGLDPSAQDCRMKIADVRRQMDEWCDKGVISIKQWRRLLDLISERQAKCRH